MNVGYDSFSVKDLENASRQPLPFRTHFVGETTLCVGVSLAIEGEDAREVFTPIADHHHLRGEIRQREIHARYGLPFDRGHL